MEKFELTEICSAVELVKFCHFMCILCSTPHWHFVTGRGDALQLLLPIPIIPL